LRLLLTKSFGFCAGKRHDGCREQTFEKRRVGDRVISKR
jgi:hypothetical protein